MWWFKKHPEIYIKESADLKTNSNYRELYQRRNNLLVSHGNIIVRGQKIVKYPVLIVYHPNTPFVLPSVYILSQALTEDEVVRLSHSEYNQIPILIKEKIQFLYLRHQSEDGRVCILEQDNIEMSGIDYFSINQIINRIRQWLLSIQTGKILNDNSEVELFYHFNKKDYTYEILYPEIFKDGQYESGIFYLSIINRLDKITFGYEKKLYIGTLLEGQSKAGIYLPVLEFRPDTFPNIKSIKSYDQLTKDPEILASSLDSGDIIKGYWWHVNSEPINFKSVEELLEFVGEGVYKNGLEKIFSTMSSEFKSINQIIYIALRYYNSRKEIEWQFFKLNKVGDERPEIKKDVELSQFEILLKNYEIVALYSQPFTDEIFHQRNSSLASRDSLKGVGVNVLGCGALGSEIADILAKAGVGLLNLVDKESLSINNVVRHLGSLNFIGILKVDVVSFILKNHNPFIQVIGTNCNIAHSGLTEYTIDKNTFEKSMSISSIADDNIEAFINEQALSLNNIVFYSRALRGGKEGRIFRVIPGKDACFNCLTLYKQEGNNLFINIPEDESLPTIRNECNNPIRPASAAELKIISSITSRILLNHLQGRDSEYNHWVWATEKFGDIDYSDNEPMKLSASFIPPHPNCKYCQFEDPINVKLKPEAKDFILNEIKKDTKVETGGVLIGFKDKDGFFSIEKASEPGPNAIKTPVLFKKDIEFCQNFIDRELENSEGKNIYIGEWHYHPSSNNKPSTTDIESLTGISIGRDYLTEKPIMIIASNEGNLSCSVHPINKPYYFVDLKI